MVTQNKSMFKGIILHMFRKPVEDSTHFNLYTRFREVITKYLGTVWQCKNSLIYILSNLSFIDVKCSYNFNIIWFETTDIPMH